MATYTERLQTVRDAIDAILENGQSVSIEGKSYTAANLDTLRLLEAEYERRAAREARGNRIRVRLATPV